MQMIAPKDASVPARLGFAADFYGTTASAVDVNENGNITWTRRAATSRRSTSPLPAT